MVYKRCCAYHYELLSTAGFRAYSVSIMPVGLLGRCGPGSCPIAGFLVVSRPMPSGGIFFSFVTKIRFHAAHGVEKSSIDIL